jgi:hypothetical protein
MEMPLNDERKASSGGMATTLEIHKLFSKLLVKQLAFTLCDIDHNEEMLPATQT